MAITYKHLSVEERDNLAVLRSQGLSLRAMAQAIGRNVGTVSREFKRNAPPVRAGYYLAHKAHRRALVRKQTATKRKRLKEPRVRAYVARQLKRGWSPELIAGRLKALDWAKTVSHEAIYQWVYEDARHLIPCLVRKNRKRQKRGYSRKHAQTHIPARVSITKRPAGAQNRSRFGHWEADTMVSRQSRPVLQVVVERKARYTFLNKMPNREAASMRKTLNKAMCKLPIWMRESLTYDNGTENTEHQLTNAVLGTKSFFCAPYTSQEKGTVENTNGLIRRFFPKRFDFATLERREVKAVERWLNNRPRKVLGFLTPAEVFREGVALRG
jgi:transposase, IS30 family